MKTITISLYNRPEYTKILFDSLSMCHGIDDYAIFIFCEPTNQEVIDLAKGFRTNQTVTHVNPHVFGCNANIFQCVDFGFSQSEYNIHFEDDTIPGKDCLNTLSGATDNMLIITQFLVLLDIKKYHKINYCYPILAV